MSITEKIIKYPREVFRDDYDMSYKAAKEYQAQVVKTLKEIFPNQAVESEWDSVTHDGHTHNHKSVYAPRVDIAVGPFNSYFDLDIGQDNTAVMKDHPLVKRLEEKADIVWNNLSRCFLAIEIVFSGNSKHIAGDFLNATSTGSIGFVVAHRKIHKKVNRMSNYFGRLVGYERLNSKGLQNLMVFKEDDFLEFLWELKHPDTLTKLKIKNKYNIFFRYHFYPKAFFISAHTTRYKPKLFQEEIIRLSVYGFDILEVVEQHDIILSPTRFTLLSSAHVYEVITSAGNRIRLMDIIDIAVIDKYRNMGIGKQMLNIFKRIAVENNCQYICVELGHDRPKEPIELQKRFFNKNGFEIWSDNRAQYSGWVARKLMNKK